MLNHSISLEDLRVPPGNRLEKLSGDRFNQFSIRINSQYRICFEWIGNNAHRRITADTALRLGKYFGNSAQFWLGLQMEYDLRKEKASIEYVLEEIEERGLISHLCIYDEQKQEKIAVSCNSLLLSV